LLTGENTTFQAKVQELVAALAVKDQGMTSQAENFKVAEEKLVQEAATGFADGFAEALVQVACANPDIKSAKQETSTPPYRRTVMES